MIYYATIKNNRIKVREYDREQFQRQVGRNDETLYPYRANNRFQAWEIARQAFSRIFG